jgi:diguanylate cyclase (GGDEF)-like protein/PAS domain S-box-containing protein
LRRRAEHALSEDGLGNQEGMGQRSLEELVHELQVHQVELEMQNDELQRSNLELEHAFHRYRDLYDNAPIAYITIDASGVVVDANARAEHLLGRHKDSFLNSHFSLLVQQNFRKDFFKSVQELFANGGPQNMDMELLARDESRISVSMQSSFIKAAEDGAPLCLAALVDLSERKQMEEHLRLSEELYRMVADNTSDWEGWIGSDGVFVHTSPSCEKISGYSAEEFLKNPKLMEKIIHEDDVKAWQEHFRDAKTEEATDFRLLHKDGSVRWVSQNNRVVYDAEHRKQLGIRFSIRDITKRKHVEMQLRHQALHDPLTGLANRTLCRDRIALAMQRAQRREKYIFGIVYLDMDHFKAVNDNFGHDFGDAFLVEVGDRLTAGVRSLDTVARIGGDEFVILLEELASVEEAMVITRRVRESLSKPYIINGLEIASSASFGIVINSGGEVDDADELLRRANLSMHKAKTSGRNKVVIFDKDMLDDSLRIIEFEKRLRRAVKEKSFSFLVEPIYSLADMKPWAFDLLVLLNDGLKEEKLSRETALLADELGLLLEIDTWVLEKACEMLGELRKTPTAPTTLHVRISNKLFDQAGFIDTLKSLMQEFSCHAEHLVLEFDEESVAGDFDSALQVLKKLKALGVKLCLADFGAGSLALTKLAKCPFDAVKLKEELLRHAELQGASAATIEAVVQLAVPLGVKVYARGVSSQGVHDALLAMNCAYAQGPFYGAPQPFDQAAKLPGEKG